MNVIKYIKHPSALLVKLDQLGVFRMSDKKFLELQYRSIMGKKLDLENPRTFNEKLQWLKLNDRKPEYEKLVDKFEVKKIVEEKIGKKYIVNTYGVYDEFSEIDFNELPESFVIKTTHYGGGNGIFLVKDKNKINRDGMRCEINKVLKKNLYYFSREWPYKNVKPRIMVEEYLTEANDDECVDYKFMCFNGKVECIFTCTERFSGDGLKVTFFDRDWKVLPFRRSHPKSRKEIVRPKDLEKMIGLAEILAAGVPFVRIDFYNPRPGVIKFGEYTLYPGAGLEAFQPEKYDLVLGELIKLGGKNAQ